MWLFNVVGLVLIALIVWWFWLYKPQSVQVSDQNAIDIVVENGVYNPAHVRVPAGKPLRLRFLRKDQSPCAAMVVFADFNISEELSLNKPKEIELRPENPGRYSFTCQMQMYRGELEVTGGSQ